MSAPTAAATDSSVITKLLSRLGFGSALALLAVAPLAHAQQEKLPPDDLAYVEKTWPNAHKTSTCLRYVVEEQGTGQPANPGDKVEVLYTGRLLNGKVFDQNLDPSHPFTFRVRRGEVIVGWDQILQLMRQGDKWIVIVPSQLAYGTRGQAPTIPPNATLVFEMKLVGIQREKPVTY